MKTMRGVIPMIGVFACMTLQAMAGVWSVDADKAITEGFAGTNLTMVFTVKLSQTSSVPCSVDYLTEAITAVPGEYVHTTGTINYPAGVNTNAAVTVTILGNNALDGTRTFRLKLTNAVESTIGTASRIGTITDKTGFTVSAPSVLEGPEGTTPNLDFVLTLTTPTTTTRPVTVYHETSDILAVAGADYTATTGTTTFDVGQTVAHVLVPILGNDEWQADRTLKLSILSEPRRNPIKTATGTITDDEEAPARVGLEPEETLYASIFASPTPRSSEGNPNFEGQSWYRADCTFIMRYYDSPARWSNSEVPGAYPDSLEYSSISYDTTVPTAIYKTDSNAKKGAAWIYVPLYRGEYEIFFDQAYAYSNGGGNPQIWKIALYRDGTWQDLVPYQSFPVAPKSGGYGAGTNVVQSLNPGDKIAFVIKTGGTAYNGGNCRIEGLGIRRMPLPGTVVVVK